VYTLHYRILGQFTLAVVLAATVACPLRAESFALEPITLDIAPTQTSDSEDLVLVAAYVPDTSSPLLISYGETARSALRTSLDRPQPSIILGLIAPGEEDDFGIEGLLQDTVAAHAFGYQDLDSREALRTSDPDLFRKLVDGGHIDPPEDRLKFALQEELARMNCYRSRIDGDFGRGSRRSVASYFKTLDNGSSWPDQNPPTNELFRSILINGDVTCQVTAAAPAPRRSTAPAPAPRNAPANGNSSGSTALPRGVFR
jgi:hypothetical protein